MLSLIGVGLYDEKDVTLRGLQEMKRCDLLFLETYTSKWKGKEKLEERLGTEIEEVHRSDLEENLGEILEGAREKRVGILVPGDPLVATTHVEILIQAKKGDVDAKVIHSSSIYSAVAETGLQIYKFGKTTTVPFQEENYRPESPYDVIKENGEGGLHTLALLDIKEREAMEVCDGLAYLLEIEKEREGNVINPNDKVIALSIQGDETFFIYDTVNAMLQRNFETPSVVIFPGELHDKEQEALSVFSSG